MRQIHKRWVELFCHSVDCLQPCGKLKENHWIWFLLALVTLVMIPTPTASGWSGMVTAEWLLSCGHMSSPWWSMHIWFMSPWQLCPSCMVVVLICLQISGHCRSQLHLGKALFAKINMWDCVSSHPPPRYQQNACKRKKDSCVLRFTGLLDFSRLKLF